MTDPAPQPKKDWVGDYKTYILFWGLPVIAMIGAISVAHPAKTLIWIAALVWMGLACAYNARRCGRTHCYYTGPFFLIMTIPVALHGFQILWLGVEGWKWLGIVIGVGAAGLWCFTEKLWGKYSNSFNSR